MDKNLTLNSVAFYREEKNTVDADAAFVYYNIVGNNKAKGLETSLSYTITEKLHLLGNYTFNELDHALLRLNPKHKVNTSVAYDFSKRFFGSLQYQYVSSRMDAFGFPSQPIQLSSYQLVNATAKYELIKMRLTIFGSMTNVFNEEFVENIGYSTRGRNFKIGLNIIL